MPSGVDIIPVNGDLDAAALAEIQKARAAAVAGAAAAASSPDAAGKGSKLENALDRLGFNKRKVSLRK
jgi:hypothetical protein